MANKVLVLITVPSEVQGYVQTRTEKITSLVKDMVVDLISSGDESFPNEASHLGIMMLEGRPIPLLMSIRGVHDVIVSESDECELEIIVMGKECEAPVIPNVNRKGVVN